MKRVLCFVFVIVCGTLCSQSIAEKKASLIHGDTMDMDEMTRKVLDQVNLDLYVNKNKLRDLYDQVLVLYERAASPHEYRELLEEISLVRENIKYIENSWRHNVSDTSMEDAYALWHQPEATIAQLVIDYGSQDYVYLLRPDLGSQLVSVNSNLPVPKESWEEMLELILSENGIGMRQLNSFLRELYLFDDDRTHLEAITGDRWDLSVLPHDARICYVLSPDTPNPYTVVELLKQFINAAKTKIQVIGHDIFIVAKLSDIQALLKIYDFVEESHGCSQYRLLTLSKVDPEDVAKILEAIFVETLEQSSGQGVPATKALGLKVIPLKQTSSPALFLFGSEDQIRHATEIVEDIEDKVEGAQGRTIFTYNCKHSQAEELAEVLTKAYNLLQGEDVTVEGFSEASGAFAGGGETRDPSSPVNPRGVRFNYPNSGDSKKNGDSFIVDEKTGSIIMVIEKHLLPMIKELLKKLDVPKKMVRIEILLFEKRISDSNHFGLNLLRFGDMASGTNSTWGNFATTGNVQHALDSTDVLATRYGILDFFMSRESSGKRPAYDLAYKFLLSQQDITIHSCPSVLAVNQTPASIQIVDEISIAGDVTNYDSERTQISYSRNQYGIFIDITPTIHEGGIDDEYAVESFITLETDITFDDPDLSTSTDRPNVSRRNIKNIVRIADGQTIILGGLRRKQAQDNKETIPFFGEIPGIGKLFSETRAEDQNREMYIFITPKIITETRDSINKMIVEELKWRPGDNPEFISHLLDAKIVEKRRLFAGGMQMLFGREE